ncbi:MAG: glycoside hydrolase family 27 protein [Prevotella sp.]|jgi:alpha-galactosidase|nr:glycoside hydrolase family 27 protein [Prevotella sp.]
MKKTVLLFAFLLSASCLMAQTYQPPKPVSAEVYNALAPTPPMGWNSWNKFGCDVSEQLLMKMADAMVASGMQAVGYRYIIVDDCWQVARDSMGNILVDKDRFPHGIKYVVDYVHSKGLKFGIYSCAGELTCGGRPGSRGYQYQDARQYAQWGVDYLKLDWCYNRGQNAEAAYRTMRDALKASGRPIVLSICEWGKNKPWEWGKGIGQLWRVSYDIRDMFECNLNGGGLGVLNILDIMIPLDKYAGPGHWNDADMLEVGNGGMTETEYITHMSLWCMLATPLIAGNDLSTMDEKTKAILTNKEVIDINQDPLGMQAHLYAFFGSEKQVFVKKLANGDAAVCFLNRGEQPWNLDLAWEAIGGFDKKFTYTLHDVWKHKDVGTTAQPKIKSTIAPHAVLMLRLIKH